MNGAADSPFWQSVSSLSHFGGACAALAVALWLFHRRERFGLAGNALVASLVMTTVWCLTVVAVGAPTVPSAAALALRDIAYLFAIYRLFASDGRHTSFAPVRPVLVALGFAALSLPLAMIAEQRMAAAGMVMAHWQDRVAFHVTTMLTMLVAVGSLVLVHNLYVGAAQAYRAVLRWPASALALVWGYELNLFTVAYLSGRWPAELAALHGLVDCAFPAILLAGASRRREELRLRPSRAVTFHSFSLLLIGGYFVAMVAISQWLAFRGGDYARWLQFGFLIVASATALVTLPSRRVRGWLRVTLTKHLFQHRFDYRDEWMRFNRTIGRKGPDAPPLDQRVIQAVADITDSPSGLLLAPDENGELALAAAWQWTAPDVPSPALSAAGLAFLQSRGFIVDLDRVRTGEDVAGETAIIPAWLREDPCAWALVPLLHFERLVGVVVLARPPQARRLDWEDFDLLRIVGQQLASYIAEAAGQEALTEAARFDEFHRRIAFVMHDIKNLASQFTLLARNAERHAENPAFRADMLVTLRNSAEKLNALMARLSRYGAPAEKLGPVDPGAVAGEVAARFAGRHAVTVIQRRPCTLAGNRDSLEQVLVHLVQNAVDASEASAPVFVAIADDRATCTIEVVDSGRGMTPEFVRNRLFKPFDSSKPNGFGIGAYEARELVRAMGGRLEVESREGLGSRFLIRLPLAADLPHSNPDGQKVA
ncbi:MAG: PEP-CTERM system histidine kinase PrsK [Sphingomonadales bacterium]|nr:PEP-CTERM system histidine kinase PrsK [Sphingomonadales bacterium]